MQVKVLLDTKYEKYRVTTVEVSGKRESLDFLRKIPPFDEYRLTASQNCVLCQRFNTVRPTDPVLENYDDLVLVLTSQYWENVFEGLKDTVNTNPVEREIVREIQRQIEQSVPYESKYHFPEVPREYVEDYIRKGEKVVSGKMLSTYESLCRASGMLLQFPNQKGLTVSKLSVNSFKFVKSFDGRDAFEHSYVFVPGIGEHFPLNIGVSLIQNNFFDSDVALNITEWFRRAKEFPTKDDLLVQIGCHYEEMSEFTDAVDRKHNVKSHTTGLLEDNAHGWKNKMDCAKELLEAILNDKERKREVVDALADTVVTAIGVLYELTGDPIGVLSEVNRSNWSKFENGVPVFDENGKIKKGEYYTKPDLDRFI